MGLDSQIRGMETSSSKRFIFKEGVKYKHMTGNDPMLFRILPAYNLQDANPATAWLPFVLPDGKLADWARLLYVSRAVGHGRGDFGSRRDFISPRSFVKDDEKVYCPLYELYSAVQSMSNDWGYLITEQRDKATGRTMPGSERKPLSRPSTMLISNIWDLNHGELGVQLGCFSTSATTSLIGPEEGLAYQKVNLPEEVLRQNYLAGFATGDLTHPSDGPVLMCAKGKGKGDFSTYRVSMVSDSRTRATMKRALDVNLLAQRYPLMSPEAFINIQTDEEMVQALVEVFNTRAPNGYHEHALLKQVFPQFKIPDPPSAPAASTTVTSGFTPPVTQYVPQTAPQYTPPPAPAAVTAPDMAAVANNAAAQPQAYIAPAAAAPVAPQGPTAPGDSVVPPGFDMNAFLAKIKGQAGR